MAYGFGKGVEALFEADNSLLEYLAGDAKQNEWCQRWAIIVPLIRELIVSPKTNRRMPQHVLADLLGSRVFYRAALENRLPSMTLLPRANRLQEDFIRRAMGR
jgi:hypothetical protein